MLAAELHLHPVARDDCQVHNHRPMVHGYRDHLFLVLHRPVVLGHVAKLVRGCKRFLTEPTLRSG